MAKLLKILRATSVHGAARAQDPWEDARTWIRHAGRYVCKPEWKIEPTTAVNHGYFFIERGRGWVDLDGTRLDARPGDVFFSRIGLRFASGHDPKRPITVLSTGFKLTGRGGVDLLRGAALPLRVTLTSGERKELTRRFEALIAAMLDEGRTGPLRARGLMQDLAAWMLDLAERTPAKRRTGTSDGRGAEAGRVADAIAWADAHLAERITLAQLAKVAHLSPVYFAALFRRETSQPPIAWVRRRRMAAARELLAEGQKSVGEVARAVGFEDPYHFSRAFHRSEGCSPRAYRESLKNPFFR
ncbi:MAG: AraC family transcriptional regulator [Planctomycetes bacterium]|nr:AraC family transcriptional regulator [Planctomycetota bacterium]